MACLIPLTIDTDETIRLAVELRAVERPFFIGRGQCNLWRSPDRGNHGGVQWVKSSCRDPRPSRASLPTG